MTTQDIRVSPLGQVEGDLDLKVTVTAGVVTSAWTEAAMGTPQTSAARVDPHSCQKS